MTSIKKLISILSITAALILPTAAIFSANSIAYAKLTALESKDIFGTYKYTTRLETEGTKIGLVKNLPKGEFNNVLAAIIKFILAITGSLAFITFTYAGIMFITAQGDETHLTKAKKMLFWAILALAIIATSYAIVLGVSQLKF